MFKADYHIHSNKSFDADPCASIRDIFDYCAKNSINQAALCDHYDVNWVLNGTNPDIDFQDTRRQINEAKQHYNSSCEFLLGIELGQPNQFPDKAMDVLSKNDFDFILCALHNARDEDDFYYIDYQNNDVPTLIALYEKYTQELCELANWGHHFHSLAHITYPVRYFLMNGIELSLKKYYDLYIKIFEILVRRGIALEVNASGLSKPGNQPLPPFELLELYRSVGGELITVGSDAHNIGDIFKGIDYVYTRLAEIGFKYISVIKDKKLVQVKICEYNVR